LKMTLNPAALIAKKRDGHSLGDAEIEALVRGFTEGTVADYQMAAWAMAVYLRGMSSEETAALTQSMLDSGRRLQWPETSPVVDKHSTGGIGDKVSLILAPLLAACDLFVPMISGRGLGPTGGTIDKLEAISGFRTDLSIDEIHTLTKRVGCAISGATPEIAPADKKLYALRDVTATVSSIPLITASIMSKKLAEGLDALVLDVKVGNGAFMKTIEQARDLARSLVTAGTSMGVRTSAMLTDMNQPLGRMVGNAVEVDESLETLRGGGPADLRDVTLALGGELLLLARRAESQSAARARLAAALDSGEAYERFEKMVAAQGGDLTKRRPRANEFALTADRSGRVTELDTERLGRAIIEMGGGRRAAGEAIDHRVGLEMEVRLGDEVDSGQRLMRVFSREGDQPRIVDYLKSVVTIGDETVPLPPLILEQVM
jgi:pyrimidine-nucleoside phosphorylase